MGQALISCAKSFRELAIAAQIDQGDDLAAVIGRGDVVIDFSAHWVTPEIAALVRQHHKALVIGTTGHTDTDKFDITKAVAGIPVVLGVELFHRRQHAVLAHAQGGGNSRPELRPRSDRDASPAQARRAERHGQNARGNSGEGAQFATGQGRAARSRGIVGERTQSEIGIHPSVAAMSSAITRSFSPTLASAWN